MYDQIPEEEWPSTLPPTFTESDYTEYHHNLFTKDFKEGLSQIKIEKLIKNREYITPMIENGKIPFYLAVNFDEATELLQITLSYSGQLDEQGKNVSEGEYALIYLFKFEKGKSLQFDKMLFAG